MTTFDATATEGADVASWDGVTIPERVRNRTLVALAVGGSLRGYVPQRPGCYLRTSRDRQGDEKTIAAMNAELDLLERKTAEHEMATHATRPRDYAAEWRNGGFEQRRALIGEIFTAIHVMPSGKGRAPFNPAHICPVYAN